MRVQYVFQICLWNHGTHLRTLHHGPLPTQDQNYKFIQEELTEDEAL